MKRFLFALLILPISAFADGGLPTQPYIYVEGKAEIEKPADMVTLRFDLVARNADQAKANQEVQAKAPRFSLRSTKRKSRKTMSSRAISSRSRNTRNEEDSPRKRGKIIGYSVTRSFSAKVRDVTAFPKLVDELLRHWRRGIFRDHRRAFQGEGNAGRNLEKGADQCP